LDIEKVGKRIKHYVLEERLGGGGMGVVWRARDTRSDELVAIKAVANDLILDSEFRIRMQDEARRHQRLHHPNIVPVPEVFEAEGNTWIVMKLIEGTSLSALLDSRANKRLDVRDGIRIIKDVLSALNYAHRHGIVHRDVKPSNVMVDHNGKVWLLDFGIAIAMGEQRRTRTGQVVGTLSYMSPEQISKPRTIDHRSDVYSVGCMFYEMLTGRPPFIKNKDGVGDSDFAMQQAHIKKAPLDPKNRVSSIPDDLNEIIMAALSKNPDERIPGCGEFLRLLEQRGTDSNGRKHHADLTHFSSNVILKWVTGFVLASALIFLASHFF
jgi:eukaryotic-like serine/threonine-protein kinase